MSSKNRLFSLLTVLILSLLTIQGVSAQSETIPSTEYAADLSKLSAEYGVELSILEGWVVQGYEPDEIFLALEISTISGTNVNDSLVLAVNADKNGWDVLAVVLGLDPESREFENLKEQWEDDQEKMFDDRDDDRDHDDDRDDIDDQDDDEEFEEDDDDDDDDD